jgi:tRNA1(Val) A37 N6-methylase TrmN6
VTRAASEKSAPQWIDYPLQGTQLDWLIDDVLELDESQRHVYIIDVLKALTRVIKSDEMSLKNRINFKSEIQDYRTLLRRPADSYLLTDDTHYKRNVLAAKSPGGTHTTRSRHNMWQMVTAQGSLKELISKQHESIVRRIAKLFDPKNQGKAQFRKEGRKALQVLYSYLQMTYSVGAAFPPFHAKFLADKYLPTEGDCLVVDPCAGWGGRLLGTLCVKRKDKVTYVGIDPETRNEEAYETIQGYYYKYLKQDLKAERDSKFFYRPFERWIKTKSALLLHGKADLVITSPPYFDAEIYNADNSKQSAKSFRTYAEWREGFYTPLVQGAFDLLKPGGIFVLNIANTQSAPELEKDARSLAKSIGFINFEYFKLAMRPTPGVKAGSKHQVLVDGTLYKFEPCFVFQKPLSPAKRSLAASNKKTAIAKTEIASKADLPARSKTVPWESIKQLYKSYDATCSDSFKRIKQKDKAQFIFANGKAVAGFVLIQRSSAGHECLYKGKSRSVPSIAYFKGDTNAGLTVDRVFFTPINVIFRSCVEAIQSASCRYVAPALRIVAICRITTCSSSRGTLTPSVTS